MASNPPAYTSSESVSRSKTSRDEMRSLADEMLRASLTRGAASPAASVSSTPPSYRRSATPAFPLSAHNPADSLVLTRERIPAASRPPIVGSASITRDSITRDSIIRDSKSSSVSNASSSASTSTFAVSAADAKARIRHLQQEMERAKADVPKRATGGLFKAACSTDLLFLIDTTGSMYSYINAAKEQVKSVVEDIKKSFLNESEVRVAVVSYKDHGDHPNIEFLDFTSSTDQVFGFLGRLDASGGADAPEDVLGGLSQAMNVSWKQQTRCIIHIADAPPHGAGVLHDFAKSSDHYPHPGSEPHGLTYEPLLKQLIQLNVNYALLRVNSSTDRMALAFAQVYAASNADAQLLPSNIYSSQVNGMDSKDRSGLWSSASNKHTNVQFEEMELGTTYSQLRHLVVRTVTASVSRTAGRMSLALSTVPKPSVAGGKGRGMASDLTAIREDEGAVGAPRRPISRKALRSGTHPAGLMRRWRSKGSVQTWLFKAPPRSTR